MHIRQCIEYNAKNRVQENIVKDTMKRIQCKEYSAENTMHGIKCVECVFK